MPKNSWRDENYVIVYQLAKQGMKKQRIAELMKIAPKTLQRWLESNRAFRKAYRQGREGSAVGENGETFIEYYHQRLSPKLRLLWEKMCAWEKETNGEKKIEALLAGHGKHVRQHLFIHALVMANFNPSEACRKCMIAKKTYDRWAIEDPNFSKLIDEIAWHRKNFIEHGLLSMVGKSEAATIFAAKTQLRDRGYDPKIEIDLTGRIASYDMAALLDLVSVDAKRELLQAIRQQSAPQQAITNKPKITVTRVDTDMGDSDALDLIGHSESQSEGED